ncbi:MAG: Gfo/Idh/MocA family protein [Bryobacteraceae bacterium]
MNVTRRSFLQSSAAAWQAVPAQPAREFSANDQIQFALIGAGGMGMGDARMALSVGGTRLVAVADVYDGRLERARELWGKGIFTTRDYREILARSDVDAVIIATPDHWHARQTIDALEAGKDVYCEKPMVQKLEQGRAVIEAEKRTGRILQVGSQYVTSVIYQKARELVKAGAIGELNMVAAWLDRNTALGAWQYTIPPDASPENIDWDRFLGDAPKRPFEPIRLFRWRNYRDYGTGIGGDLLVHLFSGLHVVTGALGPSRVFATGGLRYWKDGRDVPDVLLALLDYPGFNVALRVNFKASVAEEQFGFRFVGSEGIIQTGPAVVLSKPPKETEPGLTISTFPRAIQERILAEYRKKYPLLPPSPERMRDQTETRFAPPPGYDAHVEHHRVFWTAVRERKPVVEDATFGFRAAGPALLANKSYFENCICRWDPVAMKELA